MNHVRAAECAASALTLAGQYLGSTTRAGAACYAASLPFWWWLTMQRQLWGLLPLNIASAAVTIGNLACLLR